MDQRRDAADVGGSPHADGMSSLDPRKLRDLAMYADLHTSVNYMEERTPEIVLRLTAALRAVADQLEAVRGWLDGQDSAEWDSVDLDALDAILTAEVDVS